VTGNKNMKTLSIEKKHSVRNRTFDASGR
jgi:hypothetical protein